MNDAQISLGHNYPAIQSTRGESTRTDANKLSYLENQNTLLQEQVDQLKQSLEINKQIQFTILSQGTSSRGDNSFKDVNLGCNCLQELKDKLIDKN